MQLIFLLLARSTSKEKAAVRSPVSAASAPPPAPAAPAPAAPAPAAPAPAAPAPAAPAPAAPAPAVPATSPLPLAAPLTPPPISAPAAAAPRSPPLPAPKLSPSSPSSPSAQQSFAFVMLFREADGNRAGKPVKTLCTFLVQTDFGSAFSWGAPSAPVDRSAGGCAAASAKAALCNVLRLPLPQAGFAEALENPKCFKQVIVTRPTNPKAHITVFLAQRPGEPEAALTFNPAQFKKPGDTQRRLALVPVENLVHSDKGKGGWTLRDINDENLRTIEQIFERDVLNNSEVAAHLQELAAAHRKSAPGSPGGSR
jgi:hypothetical protein